MTVDVSVIIVTYNSRHVVGACLDALRRETTTVAYEIIVVDNASPDGTAAVIKREHPDVQVVRRPRNAGLSSAINAGVLASTGAHIMQLNPDARVEGAALATLSAYLRDHDDVGVVAPKLLNDDGSVQLSRRAFPGYATALFSRYSLLTRVLPGNRFSRHYLMSDADDTSTRDVDWVSGAALMFPRAVFDRLGGWDDRIFLFSEDVDFCRRAHDAGYRVVYHPDAVVHHSIGISERPSARVIVERHRSMWRYYRKHLSGNIARDAITGAAIAARCLITLTARLAGARMRPGKHSHA